MCLFLKLLYFGFYLLKFILVNRFNEISFFVISLQHVWDIDDYSFFLRFFSGFSYFSDESFLILFFSLLLVLQIGLSPLCFCYQASVFTFATMAHLILSHAFSLPSCSHFSHIYLSGPKFSPGCCSYIPNNIFGYLHLGVLPATLA